MIALVCVFTLFFWHLNRQQKHKGRLIQNMVCLAYESFDVSLLITVLQVGFRYTY